MERFSDIFGNSLFFEPGPLPVCFQRREIHIIGTGGGTGLHSEEIIDRYPVQRPVVIFGKILFDILHKFIIQRQLTLANCNSYAEGGAGFGQGVHHLGDFSVIGSPAPVHDNLIIFHNDNAVQLRFFLQLAEHLRKHFRI